MRRLAVFLLAALALAPAGLAARDTDGSTPWNSAQSVRATTQQRALETALLRDINAVRIQRGLRPFVGSARLSAAAGQHTREMGADGYFDHASYDSTPFWKRVERWYPSKGWRRWSVAENLLYSSPDVTADESVELWMNSPPHRANLLSRTWREIGISAVHFESAPGEYDDRPVTIVTADFGMRR